MRSKVFIARVDGYDHGRVRDAVARALEALEVRLPEKLLGKASWVLPRGAGAPVCQTHPEFLRGALAALLERNVNAVIAVDVPRDVARRFEGRVAAVRPDDDRPIGYDLELGEPLTEQERRSGRRASGEPLDSRARFFSRVHASARLYECESFIAFPKLRSSVLTEGLSAAIALGVELVAEQDRRAGQALHHARRLADLLEIAEPDLIVTDAIEIPFGGSPANERAYKLAAAIISTNAVAHDATCARILGLHPERIEHLRIAYERGYGPIFADEIDVLGDLHVGELCARVRRFGDAGAIPVVEFPAKFKRQTRRDFPLEIIAEPPWDPAGAHGVFLDWLYSLYDPPEGRARMAEWPRASVLVGSFAGAPPRPRHELVVAVGDGAIDACRGRLAALPAGSRFVPVGGDPPSCDDLDRALFPLFGMKHLSPFGALARLGGGALAAIASRFRPGHKGDERIVGASAIPRLAGRKAARRESEIAPLET